MKWSWYCIVNVLYHTYQEDVYCCTLVCVLELQRRPWIQYQLIKDEGIQLFVYFQFYYLYFFFNWYTYFFWGGRFKWHHAFVIFIFYLNDIIQFGFYYFWKLTNIFFFNFIFKNWHAYVLDFILRNWHTFWILFFSLKNWHIFILNFI